MCFRYFTTNCKISCKHATNASKQLQTARNYITNDCKHTSNALAKHSECFIVTQCTSATNASNKSQILQVPYNRCAPNTALMAECFRCASTALRKTAQMIATVLQIL